MKSPKPANFLARFWQTVRHTQKILFAPTTPLYVKAALVLGLLYCLSPWDVIPEWVPVLGVMDDLALAALLVAWANRMALPETPPEQTPHDAEETPQR